MQAVVKKQGKGSLSFEFRVEKVGVMDNDSGDDGTDELRQFG